MKTGMQQQCCIDIQDTIAVQSHSTHLNFVLKGTMDIISLISHFWL